MAYELVYTSSPEGVNHGSSGFCVVACTRGLGPRLIAALEGYSAYKPLYPHYDAENAWNNPVSRSHYIFEANGERQHILSRICFNGVDYTGRSNKLASHLVLSSKEAARAAGGPASLLLQDDLFKDAKWVIRVELYDTQRSVPAVPAHPSKCQTWEMTTGDAGWGGYLAKSFLDNPQRNVYIIYDPEQRDLIPRLFDEAINLLPEDKRWDVTFNSYFVTLPAGASCAWRGVVRDSDASRFARRSPENIVIDLARPGTLAEGGDLVTAARTGVFPAAAPPEETITQKPIQLPDFRKKNADKKPAPPPPQEPQQQSTAADQPADHGAVSFPEMPSRPRRKWPWLFLILLPLLALVVALAGVFVVVSIRSATTYGRTLERCVELRKTVADIEESRLAIEKKSLRTSRENELRHLIDETKQLSATLEAVGAKIAELENHQALFDDALGSGKLDDRQNSPGGLREICEQLSEELQNTLARLERRLESARQSERIRREKNLLPDPAKDRPVPKKSEKPKPEEKKIKPAAPPRKKEAVRKNVAASDKPDFLWKKAEALYKWGGNGGRSVAFRIGDVAPDDVSIILLPSRETCRPNEELKSRDIDENGNRIVLKTAFDPATGKLTITAERYCLPTDRFILVRTKDCDGRVKEYPLFFDLKISKPIMKGKKYSFVANGAGAKLNFSAGIEIPERIYLDSKAAKDPLRFEIRLRDGTTVPVNGRSVGGKLEFSRELSDGELKKITDQISGIEKLKSEAESADVDGDVDLTLLPGKLREQYEGWIDEYKKVKASARSIAADIRRRLGFSEEWKNNMADPDKLSKWLGSDEGKKKVRELKKSGGRGARLAADIEKFKKSFKECKKLKDDVVSKLGALSGKLREKRTTRENKLKKIYDAPEFVVFYVDGEGRRIEVVRTELKKK